MKRFIPRTLGGLALGVLLAAPAWAQEIIECPTPVTTGATCNYPQTIGTFTNVLAPTDDGSGTSLSLSGNSVSLTGTTPTPQYIFGGLNIATGVSGNASNNTVLIDGANLGSSNELAGGVNYGTGDAANNTVTLKGPVILSSTGDIAGGTAASGDHFTGNTLKLDNYTGTAPAGNVADFASYEFLLSDASQPLKVNGMVNFSGSAGARASVGSVGLAASVSSLSAPKIPLICPGTFYGTIANNGQAVSGGGRSFRIWQENDASLAGNCVYATSIPTLSPGTTPPVPTSDSVKFYIKSDAPSAIYADLWSQGASCPAASDILARQHYRGTVQGTGSDEELNELALPSDFAYTDCIVAVALDNLGHEIPGAYSEPLAVNFHTLPLLPGPVLSNGKITSTGPTGAQFTINSNIPAIALWAAVAPGATCDSTEIMDLIIAGDPSADIGSSSLGVGGETLSGSVGGLQANTSYKLCLFAFGTNTNTSSTEWSVPFHTGPFPMPPLPPALPAFSDGDTLAPGSGYTAPSGNAGFCLGGNPGSAPITLRIDNVPYTIQPLAQNTCLEIFAGGAHAPAQESSAVRTLLDTAAGRALILDSGSANIGTIVPGAPLLEARNGELVLNASNTGGNSTTTIRATVDPVCTSTRIAVLEGQVSAPDWITSPMPATGCPSDALTPPRSSFMLSDGKLSCHPSALTIRGNYARLTLKQSQSLSAGQQFYAVAGYAPAGWFQNTSLGWAPLGNQFLPLFTATESGPATATLVDNLDIRAISGAELYSGFGANAEEMMMNGRYCGVFRVAP
ncbi:MAG: hypothetical protein FWD77_00715 [Betaproteobacteria bacterium]|nr:hypothetical protein [Betaproteobacteria bacterium]